MHAYLICAERIKTKKNHTLISLICLGPRNVYWSEIETLLKDPTKEERKTQKLLIIKW